MKKCIRCYQDKQLIEFINKNKEVKTCIICREKKNKTERFTYNLNKKELNKYRREKYNPENKRKYYLKNQETIQTRTNKRTTLKRKEDKFFSLIDNLRCRTYMLLKRKKFNKTNKFVEYIGCTVDELKFHIEKQFQPGMTWENHSKHGWHVDRIIPLSSAKTEEELFKLCHYTNLQPLWAKDNLAKSDKLT